MRGGRQIEAHVDASVAQRHLLAAAPTPTDAGVEVGNVGLDSQRSAQLDLGVRRGGAWGKAGGLVQAAMLAGGAGAPLSTTRGAQPAC